MKRILIAVLAAVGIVSAGFSQTYYRASVSTSTSYQTTWQRGEYNWCSWISTYVPTNATVMATINGVTGHASLNDVTLGGGQGSITAGSSSTTITGVSNLVKLNLGYSSGAGEYYLGNDFWKLFQGSGGAPGANLYTPYNVYLSPAGQVIVTSSMTIQGANGLTTPRIAFSGDGSVLTSTLSIATKDFVSGTYMSNPSTSNLSMNNFSILNVSTIELRLNSDIAQLGFNMYNNLGNQRAQITVDNSSNGTFLLKNSANAKTVEILSSGNSYLNGGDFAINDTTPDGQLAVKSNKAPASYVLAVSSQNGTNMFGVRGDGYVSFADGTIMKSTSGIGGWNGNATSDLNMNSYNIFPAAAGSSINAAASSMTLRGGTNSVLAVGYAAGPGEYYVGNDYWRIFQGYSGNAAANFYTPTNLYLNPAGQVYVTSSMTVQGANGLTTPKLIFSGDNTVLTSTSTLDFTSAITGKVSKIGDTMTGTLVTPQVTVSSIVNNGDALRIVGQDIFLQPSATPSVSDGIHIVANSVHWNNSSGTFSADGEVYFKSNSGNVFLSPSGANQIYANGIFNLADTADNSRILLQPTGSQSYGVQATGASNGNGDNKFIIYSTAGYHLVVSSGNVGIGTTSPNTNFTVVGSSNVIGGLDSVQAFIADTTGYQQNTGGKLALGGRIDATSNYYGFAAIGGLKNTATISQNGGDLALYARPNGGSLTEYVRVLGTGPIEHQTSNAGTVLYNKISSLGSGSSRAEFRLATDTPAAFIRLCGSGQSAVDDFAKPYVFSIFQNQNGGEFNIGNLQSTGTVGIYAGGSSSANRVISVLNTMRVGINNPTPATALHVSTSFASAYDLLRLTNGSATPGTGPRMSFLAYDQAVTIDGIRTGSDYGADTVFSNADSVDGTVRETMRISEAGLVTISSSMAISTITITGRINWPDGSFSTTSTGGGSSGWNGNATSALNMNDYDIILNAGSVLDAGSSSTTLRGGTNSKLSVGYAAGPGEYYIGNEYWRIYQGYTGVAAANFYTPTNMYLNPTGQVFVTSSMTISGANGLFTPKITFPDNTFFTSTAAVDGYVLRTGDTMTGKLTISSSAVVTSSLTVQGQIQTSTICFAGPNGNIYIEAVGTGLNMSTHTSLSGTRSLAIRMDDVGQNGNVAIGGRIGTDLPDSPLQVFGQFKVDTGFGEYITINGKTTGGGSISGNGDVRLIPNIVNGLVRISTSTTVVQDNYVSLWGTGSIRATGPITAGQYIQLGTTTALGAGRIRYGTPYLELSDGSAWKTLNPGEVTGDPVGFPDRTSTVLSFVPATSVFTISGTNFKVWVNGRMFVKSTETVTLGTSVYGTWYIYYDVNGTLTASQTAWSIDSNTAQVATVYYLGTSASISDERHGLSMDWNTHAYTHATIGARYASGLALTPANTWFAMTAGNIYDEDLLIAVPSTQTCKILYRNSVSTWTVTLSTFGYYLNSPGALQYDNGTGLTAVTTTGGGSYMAIWFFGNNDINSSLYAILGQREDSTLANARTNNDPSTLSLGGLPTSEMRLLYRVIVRNNATPYIETADYRTTGAQPGGTFVASAHDGTTGLTTSLSHTQYVTNQSGRGDQIIDSSVTFTGGITVTNNSTVTIQSGNFSVGGSTLVVTQGSLLLGANTFIDPANPGSICIVQSHPNSYNLIRGRGNIDNYLQMNMQNTSSGTSASTDFVATTDDGSETAGYIDMGINSSSYTASAYSSGGKGDAYVLTIAPVSEVGGNLGLIAGSANKVVSIYTGGTTSADQIATFSTNVVSMGGAGSTTTIRGSSVAIHAGLTFVAGFDATNSRIASTNFLVPVGNATGEATQCARQVTAGTGLTGGGNFTADRTVNVAAADGITVFADSVAVNQSFAFAWTATQTFANPVTFSSNVVMNSSASIAMNITNGSNIFRSTGTVQANVLIAYEADAISGASFDVGRVAVGVNIGKAGAFTNVLSSMTINQPLTVSSSAFVTSTFTCSGQVLSNNRKVIDIQEPLLAVPTPYAYCVMPSSYMPISNIKSYAWTISTMTMRLDGGTSLAGKVVYRSKDSMTTSTGVVASVSISTIGWSGAVLTGAIPANCKLYFVPDSLPVGNVNYLEITYTWSKD